MGPYQLSDKLYNAFCAGRYQTWRNDFMKRAAAPGGTAEHKQICVNYAKTYHKMYLHSLAAALGKEFPK